jgi:hypothetical protein
VNQIGTGPPMNRTINPAAAKQRRVRSIHHDIDLLLGDVAENYLNFHLWSIASKPPRNPGVRDNLRWRNALRSRLAFEMSELSIIDSLGNVRDRFTLSPAKP